MTLGEVFEKFCYTINFFKAPFTLHFTSKRRLTSNKLRTILNIAILMYLINLGKKEPFYLYIMCFDQLNLETKVF